MKGATNIYQLNIYGGKLELPSRMMDQKLNSTALQYHDHDHACLILWRGHGYNNIIRLMVLKYTAGPKC